MKMKFLAPPVSLAALLLGLSYVDASPADLMTVVPTQIEKLQSPPPVNGSGQGHFLVRAATLDESAQLARD